MRKGVLLLLCAALLLAFCACGEQAPAPEPGPTPTPEAVPAGKTPNDNSGVKLRGRLLGSLACDAPFWTVFSEIEEIPEGESRTWRFYNYTDGLGIWNNFLVILQSTPEGHSADENADYREYAVLRADHFGWGEGYDEAVAESDWDWERFTGDLNGALIELTVTHRAGKADVSVRAETEGERSYHQSYTGIAVDGPLYACLSEEKTSLDLLD